MLTLRTLTGIAALVLHPQKANAGYGLVNSIVNSGGWNLGNLAFYSCPGSVTGPSCVAQALVTRLQWVVLPIALLSIVVMGIRMIIAQEDESVEKAKTTMSAIISGVVLSFLVVPFVTAFYTQALTVGPQIISVQVNGILNWVFVLVAPIAITTIIATALKALTKPDEGVANIQKAVASAIAGFILVVTRIAVTVALGGDPRVLPNPNGLLAIALNVVLVILMFAGLAAASIIIYAGIVLVLSFGNDEQYGKSKSLIIRALVGIIVILTTAAILKFVLIAAFGG